MSVEPGLVLSTFGKVTKWKAFRSSVSFSQACHLVDFISAQRSLSLNTPRAITYIFCRECTFTTLPEAMSVCLLSFCKSHGEKGLREATLSGPLVGAQALQALPLYAQPRGLGLRLCAVLHLLYIFQNFNGLWQPLLSSSPFWSSLWVSNFTEIFFPLSC